jgi:hypothetical protein
MSPNTTPSAAIISVGPAGCPARRALESGPEAGADAFMKRKLLVATLRA